MTLPTDGNLGPSFTDDQVCSWIMAFNQDRGLQGNEVVSIERFTVSGADPAKGISGTKTQVSDIADIPCIAEDFTQEVADALGERWDSGNKVFYTRPATAAQITQDSDHLLWTQQGQAVQKRWKPTAIETRYVGSDILYCRIVAKREPRP